MLGSSSWMPYAAQGVKGTDDDDDDDDDDDYDDDDDRCNIVRPYEQKWALLCTNFHNSYKQPKA